MPNHDNQGADALRKKYPGVHGFREAARELELDASMVWRWFKAQRKPSASMRALIQDRIGIDWRLFDEPLKASKCRRP